MIHSHSYTITFSHMIFMISLFINVPEFYSYLFFVFNVFICLKIYCALFDALVFDITSNKNFRYLLLALYCDASAVYV